MAVACFDNLLASTLIQQSKFSSSLTTVYFFVIIRLSDISNVKDDIFNLLGIVSHILRPVGFRGGMTAAVYVSVVSFVCADSTQQQHFPFFFFFFFLFSLLLELVCRDGCGSMTAAPRSTPSSSFLPPTHRIDGINRMHNTW